MLPQTNARLLSIQSDGTSEDWEAAAGAGTPKWSGNADAYVIEKVRTSFSQNEGALIKFREIQIIVSAAMLDAVGDPLDILTGDIVTWMKRGQTHTRRVMDYTDADMPELPGSMLYRRLHMEPQKLEV